MAGFFSEGTLEQVRAASDIVEVIGSYVPLKRAGANFVALCPFHKEKSPSFNVNPHRGIFHCFGCGKGGDVFTFVKEYENISFPDAVRRLAERAKIPLEMDNHPAQQQNRHLKDVLLQIHEQITQRWQNALATEACGQVARDYLMKRGVSEEAIKLFRLGYAPDAWDDTVNWAKSKGHDVAVMETSGLILKKDAGGHYDRFRGRLMFPICDEQGRVIGFSGRVLDPEAKTAKYVNSPETPIFTKGKVFFGLDKSKRALLDAQSAVVCEGQLDLIACYMAGAQNMVAPQGTALTADHARILKRYVEEVVLCFDSDNAGQNAAVRSLDSLLASGLAIRVAMVPAPHDPDSFIKEFGGEAFKELITRAEGFFDYYLNRLCATNDLGTDKGRLVILNSMAEAVHKTGNVVLVDTYAQKTALRLAVAPEAVRTEFKKAARSKNAAPVSRGDSENSPEEIGSANPENSVVESKPPSPEEFYLLKLLLLNDDHVEWIASRLNMDWIVHLEVKQLVSHRLECHSNQNWPGIAAILTALEDAASRSLVTMALAEARTITNPEEVLKGTPTRKGNIELLRDEFFGRELARLNQKYKSPELSEAEHRELWAQMQELRKLKKQPLGPLRDESADSHEPF